MVEYDEIVRPHVRMWQFARCVTGNTETVSKRKESSKQSDFCQANEVFRTNDQETIMPQGELNKIC
jgi:hypothetical protein